jgi:O-antigen ligase
VRALRHGLARADLITFGVAGVLTLAIAYGTIHSDTRLDVGVLAVVVLYLVLVTGWLRVPHVMVAISIPVFAFLPTAKVFISPVLGPVKDIVTLAAGGAVLVTLLRREKEKEMPPLDAVLGILVLAFVGLYVVNLGGNIEGEGHGIAWAQGLRLVVEPLMLLVAGLTLRNPRRTLGVAVTVLIATGVVVALYGIYQQYLGPNRLVVLGYSYTHEVRKFGNHLRSFGTLDDPFAYAAFLAQALVAAMFWMRRGPFKMLVIVVLALGLTTSFVRSAILISLALVALWLVRARKGILGFVLIAASVAAGLSFLLATAGASQTHTVRAAPNQYLTLNGRTTVWATVFSKPSRVPFGLGVGKAGTAAARAKFGVIADPRKARDSTLAVDSGYFAVVADIGLVGLAVFAALITRVIALGVAATRRPGPAGWLALAWLATILLDAVTRESFTGFPTAFLGLLLIGVALAAAAAPGAPPSRRALVPHE